MDHDELRNEFRAQYRQLEEKVLYSVRNADDTNVLSLVGSELDRYIGLFELVSTCFIAYWHCCAH